jgi:hypothetical protein
LHGQKPTDSTALRPTGRYLVSAATFKGLLLAVKDTAERVCKVSGRFTFGLDCTRCPRQLLQFDEWRSRAAARFGCPAKHSCFVLKT